MSRAVDVLPHSGNFLSKGIWYRRVNGIVMTSKTADIFENLIAAAETGAPCPTDGELSKVTGYSTVGLNMKWLAARGLILRDTPSTRRRRVQICATGKWTDWSGASPPPFAGEQIQRNEAAGSRRAARAKRQPPLPNHAEAPARPASCFKCGAAYSCACGRNFGAVGPSDDSTIFTSSGEDAAAARLAEWMAMRKKGENDSLAHASRFLLISLERTEFLWARICAGLGPQADDRKASYD